MRVGRSKFRKKNCRTDAVIMYLLLHPRRHEQELICLSRPRLPLRIANGASAPAESLNMIVSRARSGLSSHKTFEDRRDCVIMLVELSSRCFLCVGCSSGRRMLRDVYATGRGTSDTSCGYLR